ncbi:hypothetical protein [Falsirhodobacter sp. 1013]|uniref:hypothetical protein n=1 Tax=Falsirhodobacter sp. 1013 TaxID=3417566 RepID=UPI003EB990DB
MTHTTQAGLRARIEALTIQYIGLPQQQYVHRDSVLALLATPPAPQGTAPAAEPVAWRVRVKSDDPEEWSLLPAGGGADYLNRTGYECQPLYASPPPSAAPTDNTALVEAARKLGRWCADNVMPSGDIDTLLFNLDAALASRPAAPKADTDVAAQTEAIAEMLWHRFAPNQEVDWPSTHASEYRLAAGDIIAALTDPASNRSAGADV